MKRSYFLSKSFTFLTLMILLTNYVFSSTLPAREQMLIPDNRRTVKVVFAISHFCPEQIPVNVEITMMGLEPPYDIYSSITDSAGLVTFDSVVTGTYNIIIFKPGFREIEQNNVKIENIITFTYKLYNKLYPVRNLSVDPKTSIATWDKPLIVAMYNQGFEGTTFPPDNWTDTSSRPVGDTAWHQSSADSVNFGNWTIPFHDGYFALVNDNLSDSTTDGTMDYLITPSLDLREGDSYKLIFDSYFDGFNGGSATVEYSVDNGSTWIVLHEMEASNKWQAMEVDLSSLSGSNAVPSVKIAFHYSDNGLQAGGWAIDNVEVHAGPAITGELCVFLNLYYVETIPGDQTSYQFQNLEYGSQYLAQIQVSYCCSCSEKSMFSWQSTYLYPPRNISDEYVYNTDCVPIFWNPPMKCTSGSGTINAEPEMIKTEKNITYPPNVDGPPAIVEMIFDGKNTDRETWDLQFSWPTFHNDGEAGVESDGVFIYSTKWNGSRITKYSLDGTFIEDFSIPGVTDIRDLAYDGTYFYGAAADYTVYKMDFENRELIGTFQAPVQIRAIAYNDDHQTFYGNNWSTDITEFDTNGVFVSSFSTDGLIGIYGLAYDNWSGNTPYLWAYNSGDNILYQYNLLSQQLTGFTVDVPSITGTTSSAGGLFTQPDIVGGIVTIGGLAQNEKVWGLELAPSVSCEVPAGLLSYNIYVDGNLGGSMVYNGEEINDLITFTFCNLNPGEYCFQVSALYDLTEYGYPGETGESALTPCHNATVIWGYDLPFTEEWDMGLLEFNNWNVSDNHWVINKLEGNGAPSAQFKNMPQLTNGYESSLTSNPFRVDSLTEGNFWLDFNLKLDDVNQTGEEYLSIEVFDGTAWHQAAKVANSGSFDFEEGFNHVELTRYIKGNTFRIRFKATGQNSADINSWFLDNIHIYRTCDPPNNLEGEYVWKQGGNYGVQLSWEAPSYPYFNSDWLHWDKGENFTATAICEGFSAAIRWDAGMLEEHNGEYITAVNFYTRDLGFDSLVLKVWKDTNASELVYRQDVSSELKLNSWNMIWLQTPVEIESNKELWVGFTIYGFVAGTFTAGLDKGPAIAGYGDLFMNGNDWDKLSDLGMSNNWNIQALVEPLSWQPESLPLLEDDIVSCDYRSIPLIGKINNHGKRASAAFNRDLEGFKIYRSETGEEGTYVDYATVPYEAARDKYHYFDHKPNLEPQTSYWYKVSALRAGETDACESAYANSKLMPDEDYVAVLVTDIDEPQKEKIVIYPNPASGLIKISSADAITGITIIDYSGKVVMERSVNNVKQLEIYLHNLRAGVYVARIKTKSKKTLKRFVVLR